MAQQRPKAPTALVPEADLRTFNQEMALPYVAADGFIVTTPLMRYREKRNRPLLEPGNNHDRALLNCRPNHPIKVLYYGEGKRNEKGMHCLQCSVIELNYS